MTYFKEYPTLDDLVSTYFEERRIQMKNIFKESGLVLDIMGEVGKYLQDNPYNYYSFYPFSSESYLTMLEEFVSGYHYDGVLEKYLPTGKIIYHNQNKKTGNIFTHSGIIVIGYKEYIVIYIYKFGSHSFCPMRCNFRYIFENSLICTYENIKNYRFVSYIEHKGGKDTVRALRYTLFGSDTVPSNSDDILKRFIEDFNLKLEEYQKKLR